MGVFEAYEGGFVKRSLSIRIVWIDLFDCGNRMFDMFCSRISITRDRKNQRYAEYFFRSVLFCIVWKTLDRRRKVITFLRENSEYRTICVLWCLKFVSEDELLATCWRFWLSELQDLHYWLIYFLYVSGFILFLGIMLCKNFSVWF